MDTVKHYSQDAQGRKSPKAQAYAEALGRQIRDSKLAGNVSASYLAKYFSIDTLQCVLEDVKVGRKVEL